MKLAALSLALHALGPCQPHELILGLMEHTVLVGLLISLGISHFAT